MKSPTLTNLPIAAAALFLVTTASNAAVINVDVQGLAGSTSAENYTGGSANGPIASGTTWNHFTAGDDPLSTPLTNLIDDSGAATTVAVSFGSGWSGSYADGFNNNLQGDRTYTLAAAQGMMTISGLIEGGQYNLAMITGVNGSGLFSTTFSIVGETPETATALTAAGGSGNGPLTFTEGTTHVLFENITATDGSITFTTQSTLGSSTNYAGVLAGLQIQAVPEPSSAALLGLGGLTLILRRRK